MRSRHPAPGTSIQDHSLDTPEQSADRGDRKLLTDLAREAIIDFGVTRDRGFRTVGRIVYMVSRLRDPNDTPGAAGDRSVHASSSSGRPNVDGERLGPWHARTDTL